MHQFFSSHFRKPRGLLGLIVAKRMQKMNADVYVAIEKFADFSDGQRVFEIGYGPGDGIKYLNSQYQLTYKGLDFSPLMFRKAQRHNQALIRQGRLSLEAGDFLSYTAEATTYDRLIFANVSYFWPDLALPFKKIYSMLKPGGRLVFYMSDKARLEQMDLTMTVHFNRHELKDVLASLEIAGFMNVQAYPMQEGLTDRFIVVGLRA